MQNANEKRSLPPHALRWLQTEINFWRDAGLVDSATVDRLRALYVEAPDRRDSFGRFLVFATATLGALALGIALYFLLSHAWENLDKSCKIAVLVGSLVVFYLGAFAARVGKRPNFSAALFFLGAFVFGLSVWQFAEIFRFEIEFPTTYWLWGAAAFGIAFFGDRAATHYLAAALLVVWTISALALDRPTAFSPTSLSDAFPTAAYSLPIFAALGYRWGVRRDAKGVRLLYALLGVFWATLQYAVWVEPRNVSNAPFHPFYLFFLSGGVYFVASKLVADRFVASKLRLISAAATFVFLLILSRLECYDRSAAFDRRATLVFFAVCGTVALATFFAARRKRPELFAKGPERRALLVSPTGVAILTILPFLLVLFQPSASDSDACVRLRTAFAHVAVAWTNVLIVAIASVSFLVGAFRNAGLYWFGVLYFLIWLTLRYFAFDLDDATLAAVFFGAISVALFSAAFFLARLRARLDADPENVRREPAFVAFLDDALDAPTAAETSAVPQSDAAPPRRFETCALAAVVAAQFAVLGFIAFEGSRPFVPVESFVVEAEARRVDRRSLSLGPFGRARAPYLDLDYAFEELATPDDLNHYYRSRFEESPPIVRKIDSNLCRKTIYAVLKRDEETGVARTTLLTTTRPTALATDETLLVGRRESRWSATFRGLDELSLSGPVEKEFEKIKQISCRARVRVAKNAAGKLRVVDVELVPELAAKEANLAP